MSAKLSRVKSIPYPPRNRKRLEVIGDSHSKDIRIYAQGLEMTEASTRLFQRISSLRQESSSGHHFVGHEDLCQAISKELVSDVLHGFYEPKHRCQIAVTRILEKGLRVFSILAWIRQEKLISRFIEHNELDARLPMEKSQVLRVSDKIDQRFWTEAQWEFLPHKFSKTDYHNVLHDKIILPFTTEIKVTEGASGEIYKSTIATRQQSLLPPNVCSTHSLIYAISQRFH